MALIRTEGLVKRYGAVAALDGLTLEVEPGVVGLIGANGSGKSTLIKLLLGLIDSTEGRAEVLDLDAARDGRAIRERVGYMPEHDCLPPDISATNFVNHMARMSGIPRTDARERTSEVLRHVGLFEERYRHIQGYSTGMRQRVKLAQALAHDPRLLFLDEPTNGLDPAGRDEMLDLVARTGHAFGIPILMSSHLLSEIERVCDHVVVIDSGRLINAGRIEDFTNVTSVLAVEVEWDAERVAGALAARGLEASAEGRVIEVRLAADADDGVNAAIVEVVADLDVPLVRLERRRHTLEDLFQPGEAKATPAGSGASDSGAA
jgi:ABC-2 type transport system ATP-binding protein